MTAMLIVLTYFLFINNTGNAACHCDQYNTSHWLRASWVQRSKFFVRSLIEPHDPKIITMLMISVILIIMIFTTTIMIYLRYKSQV